MEEVLVTGLVRTPIGDLAGSLSGVSAVELGRVSVAESLSRAGLAPEDAEEVILGNVLQAGLGQNPARQVSIHAGIPKEVPAYTVNKVCGSGLKAVELGWLECMLGRRDCVIAGGTESMSQAPYVLKELRLGAGLGDKEAVDTIVYDGLFDIFNGCHMGITAENIAEKYGVSRERQDEYALLSQTRCAQAGEKGFWKAETVPVTIQGRKREIVIERDEHPRPGATLEKLARIRPAFKEGGTVTAGNASGINDGAATAVLLRRGSAAAEKALARRYEGGNAVPLGVLKDFASVGCDPAYMGLGPLYAIRKLLEQTGTSREAVDLWEINEAFAVQAVVVTEELGLDLEKVNVNGGAIALGHPIGTSGSRVLVTLLHELKRRGLKTGVAALCIGGGMGIACLVESIN
jgi:acetyl-CoA C-acetyltransferase